MSRGISQSDRILTGNENQGSSISLSVLYPSHRGDTDFHHLSAKKFELGFDRYKVLCIAKSN